MKNINRKTSRGYSQGRFVLKNPQTYIGNADMIYYRSSWERLFMAWVDALSGVPNSPIISWNSEEVKIPYYFSLDQKHHTYYVDFAMKYRHHSGEIITCLIEIKPYNQTILPNQPKKQTPKSSQSYAKKMIEYHKNQAKWEAARDYCSKNNIEFKVITENELGLNKDK